jgi:hypothetical protein
MSLLSILVALAIVGIIVVVFNQTMINQTKMHKKLTDTREVEDMRNFVRMVRSCEKTMAYARFNLFVKSHDQTHR